MTTQKIEDYLIKQLFISKNIVTYRSLSRELGIHVNVAKNELAAFHTKNTKSPDQVCSATYLVSGQVLHGLGWTGKSKGSRSHGDMDVDMDYGFPPTSTPNYGFAGGSDQDEGDVVVQICMTVVGEDGLEAAKAKYETVTSVHIYSLSPSPIRDADLLCAPTRQVREIDHQKGVEMAKTVGRVIGRDIKMREGGTKAKGRAATTTAQPPAPRLRAGPSNSGSTATTSGRAEEKGKVPVKEEPKKAKQTGKPSFFTPKPQAQSKEKEKEKEGLSNNSTEAKGKMFFGATPTSSTSSARVRGTTPVHPPPPPREDKPQAAEPTKRGTKRKSTTAVLSNDGEGEMKASSAAPSGPPSRRSSKPPSVRYSSQPTKAMSELRLHKGAILSDDEDDERPKKRALKKLRRKSTYVSDDESGRDLEATNEANKALKSMMEIDDDQVEKVMRKAKIEALRQEEEEEIEPEQEIPVTANKDEDAETSDDKEAKPKPKPRKKKQKKTVPVGRNGLKKRRVMKSRTLVDEKGYMVTEDYSSYESVDEEEEEPAPAKKGNGGKRAISISSKKEKESTETMEPEGTAVNASTCSGDARSKQTTKAASSSMNPSTNKTARTKGGQKQKTLNTFFGPPRTTK